jgi:hypothetical protein
MRRAPSPPSFGILVRGALVQPFSAPRLTAATRLQRAEHPVQPVALVATRPRSRGGAESRGEASVAALEPRKHPQRQPALESGMSLAEVENTIVARIDKNIEQKIVAVVKQAIGSDAEYSRMTDRVYGSLYDRLVLEKERLG